MTPITYTLTSGAVAASSLDITSGQVIIAIVLLAIIALQVADLVLSHA